MFQIIQQINKKYWIIYLRKYKDVCYNINFLLNTKNKIENFIRYLIRVGKPIFYIRFRKRFIVYYEKWLGLYKKYNKYNILLRRKEDNKVGKPMKYYSNRFNRNYFGNKSYKFNKNKSHSKRTYVSKNKNIMQAGNGVIKKINIFKFNLNK